jgi:hypothetical protein
MLKKLGFAVGSLLLTASVASASSFTFNNGICTTTCGTVTVTQVGLPTSGVVDVLVTFVSGVGFVGTGAGADFGFTLAGSPTLTSSNISIIQSGQDSTSSGVAFNWALSGATGNGGSGSFALSLSCDGTAPSGTQACGPGSSNTNFGPFEFHLSLTGITPDSFIANDKGFVFLADVINQQGATGLAETGACLSNCNVTITSVPEPATLSLLALGLAGFSARALRSRRRA